MQIISKDEKKKEKVKKSKSRKMVQMLLKPVGLYKIHCISSIGKLEVTVSLV